jgi:hypothetical protein
VPLGIIPIGNSIFNLPDIPGAFYHRSILCLVLDLSSRDDLIILEFNRENPGCWRITSIDQTLKDSCAALKWKVFFYQMTSPDDQRYRAAFPIVIPVAIIFYLLSGNYE